MFETIERESKSSGGSGPQWLSSHPNPGNRTEYITKEAGLLAIPRAADDREFDAIKTVFESLPPAKSTSELAKAQSGSGGESVQTLGTPGQPVPAPSLEYRNISGGGVFRAAVPDNWSTLASNGAVKVAPKNGYGQLNGRTVFSHGIEFGLAKAGSRDLREATSIWLKAVARNNPQLRLAGDQQALRISERSALKTPLVNPSPLGGEERIGVYTTFTADGNLFYYLTIVPDSDAAAFEETFRRVGESIRLTDVR
jgi:hypothetical protein